MWADFCVSFSFFFLYIVAGRQFCSPFAIIKTTEKFFSFVLAVVGVDKLRTENNHCPIEIIQQYIHHFMMRSRHIQPKMGNLMPSYLLWHRMNIYINIISFQVESPAHLAHIDPMIWEAIRAAAMTNHSLHYRHWNHWPAEERKGGKVRADTCIEFGKVERSFQFMCSTFWTIIHSSDHCKLCAHRQCPDSILRSIHKLNGCLVWWSCSVLTHLCTWRLTNRGQKSIWPINVVTRSGRKKNNRQI